MECTDGLTAVCLATGATALGDSDAVHPVASRTTLLETQDVERKWYE
jgi:hypothetical protein